MMICSKLLGARERKARVKEIFSTQNKGIDVSVCLHCNLQFPPTQESRKVERSVFKGADSDRVLPLAFATYSLCEFDKNSTSF